MYNFCRFLLMIVWLLISPQNDYLSIFAPRFIRGPINYKLTTNDKIYVLGEAVEYEDYFEDIVSNVTNNTQMNYTYKDMESMYGSSSDAIVKLYLFTNTSTTVGRVRCTGIIVHQNWVLSAAFCLEDASSQTYLKICSDIEDALLPDDCVGLYAKEIYYPRHEWYNTFAYVFVRNVSNMTNRTKVLPVPSEPVAYSKKLKNCVIQGYTNRDLDELSDARITPRTVCRPGYYCFDDEKGWGCDIDIGSPLLCDTVLRGVYVGPHPLSCDNPYVDEVSATPVEEERNAVLLFINIAAYYHMYERIITEKFFAILDETTIHTD